MNAVEARGDGSEIWNETMTDEEYARLLDGDQALDAIAKEVGRRSARDLYDAHFGVSKEGVARAVQLAFKMGYVRALDPERFKNFELKT